MRALKTGKAFLLLLLFLLFQAEIYAEIGEVINGTKIGYKDKTTVFKSLGESMK